jgi:hypothetical protein
VNGQLHAPTSLPPVKELNRRLDGPQSRSGRRRQKKILDPTGTRTPTPPRSQSLYRLRYPGLQLLQANATYFNCINILVWISNARRNSFMAGRAIAQAVSRWVPTSAARVRARVWSCGICGGQNGAGAVFSEYFGSPCQSSFHQLLHSHPRISSGACTIGQKWPQYQADLVPPH